MSVYIKGMEIPHDCDECKLCAFIPVGDYGINRKCMPLNAKAEITIRRTDCPLVPVPPHGRLIDADAVVRKIKSICGTHWTTVEIERAHTIIPPSRGEEDE